MSLTADHKGILLSSHFPEETEAAPVSNLPEIIPVGFAGVLTTVVFRRVNLIIKSSLLKVCQRLLWPQDKSLPAPAGAYGSALTVMRLQGLPAWPWPLSGLTFSTLPASHPRLFTRSHGKQTSSSHAAVPSCPHCRMSTQPTMPSAQPLVTSPITA